MFTVLQFTVPVVRRVNPPTPDGVWTAAPMDPIPVDVSYQSGAYVVACIGDGEEYDAATGRVLVVEEAGRLECNSVWTWQVQDIARAHEAVLRSERDYRYGSSSVGLTCQSRVDRYWREEIALLHRDNQIVLQGECEPLEKELESKMQDEYCRVLWQAWKFLVQHEELSKYEYKGMDL